MKLILGISGQTFNEAGGIGSAGSGKDAVADHLVAKHRAVKVALADPLKRICKEVFDFTDEQLWGPSEARNEPDPRWKRPSRGAFGATTCLTPRHALQQLGTEWGRDCSPDVWVQYALKTAQRILDEDVTYNARSGLQKGAVFDPIDVVAISDVRFENEHEAIKKAGGKIIRVRRQIETLSGTAGSHASERGLSEWGGSQFDYVIDNAGTLDHLGLLVDRMMAVFSGRILPYSEEQKDVPPFMRGR